jgi:hypothetical protein
METMLENRKDKMKKKKRVEWGKMKRILKDLLTSIKLIDL